MCRILQFFNSHQLFLASFFLARRQVQHKGENECFSSWKNQSKTEKVLLTTYCVQKTGLVRLNTESCIATLLLTRSRFLRGTKTAPLLGLRVKVFWKFLCFYSSLGCLSFWLWFLGHTETHNAGIWTFLGLPFFFFFKSSSEAPHISSKFVSTLLTWPSISYVL